MSLLGQESSSGVTGVWSESDRFLNSGSLIFHIQALGGNRDRGPRGTPVTETFASPYVHYLTL